MARDVRMYLHLYEMAVVEIIKWGYCTTDADAHKIADEESTFITQAFSFGQLPIDCVLILMQPVVKAKAQP